MKFKKIIAVALCIFCFCGVSSAMAWLSYTKYIDGLNIKFAKIDSVITLYSVSDINNNGYIDSLPTEELLGSAAALTQGEYDVKAAGGQQSVSINFSSTGFLPTMSATYLIKIENKSDVDNTVLVKFENPSDTKFGLSTYTMSECSMISAYLGIKNTDGRPEYGNKANFGESITSGVFSELPITVPGGGDVSVPGLLSSANSGENIIYLYVKLYFEVYSELSASVQNKLSKTDYDTSAGATLLLPMLCVYLEAG